MAENPTVFIDTAAGDGAGAEDADKIAVKVGAIS